MGPGLIVSLLMACREALGFLHKELALRSQANTDLSSALYPFVHGSRCLYVYSELALEQATDACLNARSVNLYSRSMFWGGAALPSIRGNSQRDLLNPGSVFMIWLSEQLDECVYPENARREPYRILADLQIAQLCFELGLCKAELLLCNRGRLTQRSGWHSSSLIKTYFNVSLPGSPSPAPVSPYIPTPALKEMWFEFRGFPLP